jgi:hypothetical protein
MNCVCGMIVGLHDGEEPISANSGQWSLSFQIPHGNRWCDIMIAFGRVASGRNSEFEGRGDCSGMVERGHPAKLLARGSLPFCSDTNCQPTTTPRYCFLGVARSGPSSDAPPPCWITSPDRPTHLPLRRQYEIIDFFWSIGISSGTHTPFSTFVLPILFHKSAFPFTSIVKATG